MPHSFLSDAPLAEEFIPKPTSDFAGKLKDALREIPKEDGLLSSFSCAVYGAWGSGKTTVLRAIEKEYTKDSVVLLFEPWRYENETHLLVPLIVELHAKIHASVEIKGAKEAAKKTATKVLGRFMRKALRVGGKLVEKHIGVNPTELGEEFFKHYSESQDGFSYDLSEVKEFKEDFEKLIKIAAGADPENEFTFGKRLPKPVIILVDDLDRCAPEQVVRLLEGMKLFLSVPGVLFFLALDERQVARSVADHLSKHGMGPERAVVTARRYLEKFFQHEIHIGGRSPDFEQATGVLRARLSTELQEALKDDAEWAKHSAAALGLLQVVRANPRCMKRAARWLYIEVSTRKGVDQLVRRFADYVFSINWDGVWLKELESLGYKSRQVVFVAFHWLLTCKGYYQATYEILKAATSAAETPEDKLEQIQKFGAQYAGNDDGGGEAPANDGGGEAPANGGGGEAPANGGGREAPANGGGGDSGATAKQPASDVASGVRHSEVLARYPALVQLADSLVFTKNQHELTQLITVVEHFVTSPVEAVEPVQEGV